MNNFADILAAARNTDAYWLGRVKLNIATQLQDHLKAAGITQDAYAQKLNVKPPQVSRMLNGQGNPTLETLVKMGRALGYVPRVTFVPVAAQEAGFDAQTDVSGTQLDIHCEEVKPVSNVFQLHKNRQHIVKSGIAKTASAYQSKNLQFALAA
jgi:transcriptional regulator with XRE-family HTH domain